MLKMKRNHKIALLVLSGLMVVQVAFAAEVVDYSQEIAESKARISENRERVLRDMEVNIRRSSDGPPQEFYEKTKEYQEKFVREMKQGQKLYSDTDTVYRSMFEADKKALFAKISSMPNLGLNTAIVIGRQNIPAQKPFEIPTFPAPYMWQATKKGE